MRYKRISLDHDLGSGALTTPLSGNKQVNKVSLFFIRAPLNLQLADLTAVALARASSDLVQLYKRISLDHDLEEQPNHNGKYWLIKFISFLFRAPLNLQLADLTVSAFARTSYDLVQLYKWTVLT